MSGTLCRTSLADGCPLPGGGGRGHAGASGASVSGAGCPGLSGVPGRERGVRGCGRHARRAPRLWLRDRGPQTGGLKRQKGASSRLQGPEGRLLLRPLSAAGARPPPCPPRVLAWSSLQVCVAPDLFKDTGHTGARPDLTVRVP